MSLQRRSIVAHAKQCLAAQGTHARLNAFISRPDPAAVLAQAAALQDEAPPSTPQHASPLHGQLVAIKDNICTRDLPTTAASRALHGFASPYDATVVQRLRDLGAIIAGKTNMDEFGMGSHSTFSASGAVTQAGDVSAGGSSGGSAVAVATGQCAAALGTDTGGSVRLPAAYCGVVGFKPSYGRLSRWGVIAYANSLDTVGVFARDVATARLLYHGLDAHDPQDPTSVSPTARQHQGPPLSTPQSKQASRKYRIGVPTSYLVAELDPSIRSAWLRSLTRLSSAGHTLYPVSLPSTQHALSAYYILAPAEASSNLARYDGVRYGTRAEGPDGTPESVLFSKTRGLGFGEEVRRRILLGTFTLSADAMGNYYQKAQRVRRMIQREFDSVFAFKNSNTVGREADGEESESESKSSTEVDVLLCPTSPTPPPSLAELQTQDPVQAYMNDIFTVPASLAGLPAISLPVSSRVEERENERGMPAPVGMQVIGQYGDDASVLDFAEVVEQLCRARGGLDS